METASHRLRGSDFGFELPWRLSQGNWGRPVLSLAENVARGSPMLGIRSVIDLDGYAGAYCRERIPLLAGWRIIA
jgi:hypothetical protein